jgi:protein tyrosine phosphatase (PTP) superfamily phosphohydrolase (DUF442 family)
MTRHTARRLGLSLLFALAAASPAAAQELDLIKTHPLEGQRGGRTYTGQVTIRGDATFALQRRYANGQVEREQGDVLLIDKNIVLERPVGLSGSLAGVTGLRRSYGRDDGKGKVRWRSTQGGDWERFSTGKTKGKLKNVWRALTKGKAFRWLLNRNRGQHDSGALRIERSRQPRPKDLRRFKKKGGKTVLSLNGDQDKELKDRRWKKLFGSWGPKVRPKTTKINLRRYIRDLGLGHYHVKMSSKNVPTSQQLTDVFKVLLDDSKKPILMHCTGGADRTGVIGAIYDFEFKRMSKADAKRTMRQHMWTAIGGTEIQGAFVDLHQPNTIRLLLQQAGYVVPLRYR